MITWFQRVYFQVLIGSIPYSVNPFQFICLIQYDFWFFKSVAFALWFASFLKKRFIWLIYF